MDMLRAKLDRAVELNLLSRGFVKGLDLRETAISFSDKDNKLLIAINYAKWIFGKVKKTFNFCFETIIPYINY